MSKTPIELLIIPFEGEDRAGQVLKEMRGLARKGAITVLNAAVLVKDAEGKATLYETEDVDAKRGALFGAAVGALIGLLGGPAGAIVGAAAGAATGGAAAGRIDMGFPDDQLKGLQARMMPGTSAVVALVEHRWVDAFRQAVAERVAGAELIEIPLDEEIIRKVEKG
jgi:uncharacterized membrane protein